MLSFSSHSVCATAPLISPFSSHLLMMIIRTLFPLIVLSVVCCYAEEVRSKSKVCANVFCGAGRECAVTDKGEPTCLCIETYRNHCELHRDACLTGLKVQVAHDGHCEEKKMEKVTTSPIVCYLTDRNELRSRVIEWLQSEVEPDGWFSKGSNFSDVLLKYFQNYDNGDAQLDSAEFLKSLCVDALIELSDENADWKLSFDEFLNCLRPGFNPPERKCALEDETYEDGAETQMECNRCVCACGNWVCTAVICDGPNKIPPPEEMEGSDQEMTEEEWTRRVAELNKHQETVEKMKVAAKEV
ncbi:Follistatin-related protein 1 [Labeo rohita]|uniref:Follistatin-related protein 1 n=1 Tax=Labeo rohita TaxID=84645 RepID=A0ABQ8MZF6_LABRO|nr:Follistatin-related protein 1 [Labeo rohita]